MFINCPHCQALVATDLATDLPPAHCPRCQGALTAEPPPPATHAAGTEVGDTPPMAPRAAALVEAIARATGSADGLAAETAALAAAGPTSNPTRADAVSAAVQVAPQPAPVPSEPGDIDTPAEAAAIERASTAPDDGVPAHPADAGNDLGAAPDVRANVDADIEANPGTDTDTDTDTDTMAGADAAAAAADAAPPPGAGHDAVVAPTGRDHAGAAAAPSFARFRARGGPGAAGRGWLMPALATGLGLLLGVQWLLADRVRLAADPRWRPLVSHACGLLRCQVPAWHEPSAFVLLERDVRPHPRVPDALQVTASFRNDARWPQPWPELVLSLSDVDGRTVGARAFVAGEYLGGTPGEDLIASGQTATARLEIREPRPRSVAFAFDFR